ncbi:MAG: flagellar basal body rod protein FlgC [Deltaproteobacteria bacterium]|nr:flagellar basal body rod protein FlgC [Deltaproteobacteria bacterium]MBW2673124.1 flagellar basal body rod protein FlgC [Deltaproteobacteria bacterium]
MEFLSAFRICASGLSAQREKMAVIVSNLANVNTTRTPEGGAYKRKMAVFSSEAVGGSFDDTLQMVKVERIKEDKASIKMVFDPAHPDANEKGLVAMPDINTVREMADMLTANRAYEACVTAFDATKNMALKALELGK